jgi:predicted ATPase
LLILTLAVCGYRSIRNLVLPLERLNVITGGNGTGKSSLYRALRLLAEVAQGRAIASLALEGGLQSTLWAGPEAVTKAMKRGAAPVQGTRRLDSVALKLGFASEDYGYAIDLGLPIADKYRWHAPSLFNRDPEIKAEAVWAGETLKRSNVFATRINRVVQVLTEDGRRAVRISDLAAYDSMMTHAADPKSSRELLVLRERMRSWRFYDHFRTDREAPARISRPGTRTFALAGDGADLAAALQTVIENGDDEALSEAIGDAFPDSSIAIEVSDGLFELRMQQHGLLRPLRASELSDGTLRYLLLVAALVTPVPPPLIALNEPETSLHPGLLAPLGRLIANASKRSQLIVVTHSPALVDHLRQSGGAVHELAKEAGETVVRGLPAQSWTWPSR